MANKSIKAKAEGILKDAKECGLDTNSFFITSYHLLLVQIEMLEQLEKSFQEDGATITKEYVKGRENVYCHPAVDKYTKVSDSAMNKIEKLKEMIDKARNNKSKTDGFAEFGGDE